MDVLGLENLQAMLFFAQHYPTMDVSGRFPFNQEGLVKVSAREILERKLSDHRPTAQSERAFRKGICISRSSAICHWYPRFKLHLVTVWAFILQDCNQSHNESEPAARIQYSSWMFLALLLKNHQLRSIFPIRHIHWEGKSSWFQSAASQLASGPSHKR